MHPIWDNRLIHVGIGFLLLLGACTQSADSGSTSTGGSSACVTPSLTASQWTPAIPGAGASQYKQPSLPSETTLLPEVSGELVSLNDPWSSAQEIAVSLGTFSATDFDVNGSLTLIAETKNFPFSSGGAYPVLVGLEVQLAGGGTVDLVNLKRAGTGGDCAQSGMYICSGSSCSANSSCTVQSPSSFSNRRDWEQFQISSFGYVSHNSFPRCEGGAGQPWSSSDCPSAVSGPLPAGVYTAKYILMTDVISDLAGATANLRVSLIKKQDATARNIAASNGAIDLNVVIVGGSNVSATQSALGRQNLNLLFEEVQSLLSSEINVKLGDVRALDWSDAQGGGLYSTVNVDDLGDVFECGSLGVAQAGYTSGINVFLVDEIPYDNSGLTILGLAGAIFGPPVFGLPTSGLAFTTFGLLGDFNASCTVGNCPRNSQDDEFLETAVTIAHEIGHYLGLNHPSESRSGATQNHDSLTDTPQCLARSYLGSYRLDQFACIQDTTSTLNSSTCATACPNYFSAGTNGFNAGSSRVSNFCPTAEACQFNHLMWWTTKYRKKVAGAWQQDGNMISDQSSARVQWNPHVQ